MHQVGEHGPRANVPETKGNLASRKQPMSGSSRTPLYYRLAELLINKIEAGEYKKGDLLPGDNLLASKYGVSVITVRAAMKILMERGQVARYPGKGSFVLSPAPILARWGLGSVDDLLMTGLKSRLVLLKKALMRAPDSVSEKYYLPPGAKLYWFRTVRINKDEPFFFTDIYHPVHIGVELAKLDFSKAPVRNKLMITLVERHCGVRLDKINQTMSAELASRDVAKTLKIKIHQPVLVIDREYFSTEGELVQISRSRYRVDLYRYTINVSRLRDDRAGQNSR